MKPHEEQWDNGRDFEVTVCGPELDRDIDASREALARAGPNMARALNGMICADPTCTAPQCRAAKAALQKAGVPL